MKDELDFEDKSNMFYSARARLMDSVHLDIMGTRLRRRQNIVLKIFSASKYMLYKMEVDCKLFWVRLIKLNIYSLRRADNTILKI